ncbi:MAG: preprotein translocase subunit YajC [Propionibacteriaceae bacterium]|jgi:preprotein translocase subunit YajC|nr:preprotein translocase subunit YajC [Propionibacteriaceae bacterium]
MSWSFIIVIAVMAVAMYFLMIRPQKKQQQKQQEMMNSLGVGSRVMLGSGIYGTIRHMGEKQAIIEISPGVDLTILRAAIRGSVSPDEEEFEYADEARAIDADGASDDSTTPHDMQAFEADLVSPFAPDGFQSSATDSTTVDSTPDSASDEPAAAIDEDGPGDEADKNNGSDSKK